MASRGRDSSGKDIQNDTLLTTSPTPFRSDSVIFSDGPSKAADTINWPRMPELEELQAAADHICVAGYFGTEELMDTSAFERPQLYKTLAGQ